MNELDKVLQLAYAEIGYLEKKSNSQLDDKTANAGRNNYTKYARDLDAIKGFYNGAKNGYAWCDMFIDWIFVKCFGVERAKELLCYGGPYGAGCGESMSYYKNKGQLHTTPKKGDQIFFKNSSGICHTGLVINVDSNRVYTIEGNTSSASGVVANGGAVEKKSYNLTYSAIAGYGRPNYILESEEDKMLNELIEQYGKEEVKKALETLIKTVNDDGIASNWAVGELEEAVKKGITDGKNPEMFATREQVACMVYRAIK